MPTNKKQQTCLRDKTNRVTTVEANNAADKIAPPASGKQKTIRMHIADRSKITDTFSGFIPSTAERK